MKTILPAYLDVRIALDSALAANQWPARYTLSTPGEATHWRLRANRFRSELRKYDKRLNDKPVGESVYDDLVFLLDGASVVIDKRFPTGKLTFEGRPIPLVQSSPDSEPAEDDDADDFNLDL